MRLSKSVDFEALHTVVSVKRLSITVEWFGQRHATSIHFMEKNDFMEKKSK